MLRLSANSARRVRGADRCLARPRWRRWSSPRAAAVAMPDLAMLTATATFLVLPYAFNYDLTVVMIAAVRLWADPQATRVERALGVTGFLSPQIGMLLAPLGVPAIPLMLAALFAGQLSRALSVPPLVAPRQQPQPQRVELDEALGVVLVVGAGIVLEGDDLLGIEAVGRLAADDMDAALVELEPDRARRPSPGCDRSAPAASRARARTRSRCRSARHSAASARP